jgi:carbamoyl-phosphate synthase/aspartate carbamoyltransferase/dihydroorotase
MLTAVHEGKLTLDDLIAKMHTNPKRIFNLPDQPDTYVEVDLDRAWTLPEKGGYSKCAWSPYAGRKVRGCVRRVVVRGVTAYVDGQVLAPLGSGVDLRASSRKAAAPRTPEVASLRPPQSPSIPHMSSNPALIPAIPSLSAPVPHEISAEALHLDRGVVRLLPYCFMVYFCLLTKLDYLAGGQAHSHGGAVRAQHPACDLQLGA